MHYGICFSQGAHIWSIFLYIPVKTENTELPFIFSGIFTFLISFLIVFYLLLI